MIQKRSIPLCIILSLVTCGIYGLYWLVCLANDINTASGRDNDTSGGMVLLLSIITCNIYGLYWMYKAGEKVDEARAARQGRVEKESEGAGLPGRMFMPFCRYPAVAQQKKVTCQLVILPYVDMYFIFCANAFLSRYRCILRGIAQGDVAGHDIVFRMSDSRLDVLGFLSHWDAGYA